MAGLLEDPQRAAQLQLGLGLLSRSGPSRTPVSLGQAMGEAGQESMQTYQQADQNMQMKQMRDMQMQQQQMQMAKQKQDQELQQRKLAAMQQLMANPAIPQHIKEGVAAGVIDMADLYKPQKLGEGDNLVSPIQAMMGLNGTIASGNPVKPKLPADVQAYEYARAQGYKGTYEQFAKSMKQAGAPSIQNFPAPVAALNPVTGQIELIQFGNKGSAKPTGFKPAPDQKPPTEAQANANIFATRADEANRILTDLEGKYSPSALLAREVAGSGVVGAGANALLSESDQKAEQAQRDFLNAALRKESGAVIGPTEFESGKRQYFPQPGDSKAVIEQKRKNRITEIEGIKTASGPLASNKKPQQEKNKFDSMPPAVQYKGRRIKGEDGTIYKSNGMSWVKE